MAKIRIRSAAAYLGVSDDTVRRWVDAGVLASDRDDAGRTVVEALDVAHLARENAVLPADPSEIGRSARNRMVGVVTEVVSDTVMSQVELQCGPHRIVSLMTTEAVRDLALVPGSIAIAVVKSTMVVVETPAGNA